MVNSSLETVNEETITEKLSPTVCGQDVESILMTAKSDKLSEIDVNITVISIGSSDMETKKDDVEWVQEERDFLDTPLD